MNRSRKQMAKLFKRERAVRADKWETATQRGRLVTGQQAAKVVRKAMIRVGGRGSGRVRKWHNAGQQGKI